jgi:transcriptional regulator with XRE-family HTH domain
LSQVNCLRQNTCASGEQHGLLQKEVAAKLGIGYTNYNKIETEIREPSVKELEKLAKFYKTTVDNIINLSGDMPKDILIGNQPEVEQLHLIQQLDDDDKQTVFKIIDTMLTKKKFKDFFNKNVAML